VINRAAILTVGPMLPLTALAEEIVQTTVNIVRRGSCAQLLALDVFPVALYVTDADGFISYFNPACSDFAGREPRIGQDRWCVTWKLYTDEGDAVPHDQCPMAVAIRTRRAVRGVTALAERPNGTRINFLPFPTPVVGNRGEMLGAVNMLINTADCHQSMLRDLHEHLRTWQRMLVEEALSAFNIRDVRKLMREMELEVRRQPPRILH
jgi:hypothetical protein